MWRPLMPPAALHQSANAVACWGNSASSPGSTVLAASLNTAMWMVFELTPRTEDAPPGPGSQILPTPGQAPDEVLDDKARLADVAAAAVVDASAPNVPATIKVASASGSADFRSSARPLQNILIPPRSSLTMRSFNQHPDRSGDRAGRGGGAKPHHQARDRALGW